MRFLASRTLFLFSNSSPSHSFPSPSFHLLQLSQFSTYSSHHHSYPLRRQEEESRNVKVVVWWDFENCHLPTGINVFKIAHFITAAIRANGMKGPVQITGFGDVLQLSRANQEALSATGINLSHVPNSGKNSADRSLLIDLMDWVSQNPPPAHLFLISGDRDFATILHRLRMNNYNVLLASPENAPGILCSAASIMWHWYSLIRGENLIGRHFNQPPDGPFGSWYGHYRTPLEDPFTVFDPPSSASSKNVESLESGSEFKLRPIPKVVLKVIRHVLKLHPKGISITEMRSELGKSNVSIDKDLYGYKKFSRFLLSMSDILKVQSNGDGKFIVYAAHNNGDSELDVSMKQNGVNGSSCLSSSNQVKVQEQSKNMQQPSKCGKSANGTVEGNVLLSPDNGSDKVEDLKCPSLIEKVIDVPLALVAPDYKPDRGLLNRFWRKLLNGEDDVLEKKSCNAEAKAEGEKEKVKLTSMDAATPPSSSNVTFTEQKGSETNDDKSSVSPGILNRIAKWFRFQRSSEDNKKTDDESCEKLNQIKSQSEKRELLSDNSFWTEMESFIGTPEAATLISQSKTREEMVKNLGREGPSVLKSLGENNLLYLVNLLISEKKWVDECPSQATPFKLTRPVTHCPNPNSGSSEVKSIFLRSPENDGEKKEEVSSVLPLNRNIFLGRSRSEIIGDCQKLVNEILKEYPEGYNVGSFKRLFLERYGYILDVQKLGYQKLSSLLLTLPGLKIESTYIIPDSKASDISHPDRNDVELSEPAKKDDDFESPWEELGPVTMKKTKPNGDYESPVSDDDLTDSEGSETDQGKAEKTEEDSSLLQILDSWYSHKEGGGDGKEKEENAEGMVDCAGNASKPSVLFGAGTSGTKSESDLGVNRKKPKLKKSYSFVSDPDENNKERLIDGILGSLKKSSESKMPS